MITRFPTAPPQWSTAFANLLIAALTRYFNSVVSKDEATPRIILQSPAGKTYEVRVADDGILYTAAIDGPAVAIGRAVEFRAGMVAGQSIPATDTVPTYFPPVENIGGYFDQTTGRFAPPTGLYQISANVGASSVSINSNLHCAFYKNGTLFSRSTQWAPVNGVSFTANISASIALNAGDYVEARIASDIPGHTTDFAGSGFSAMGVVTQ